LADLQEGETGVVQELDLPEDVALRLMELGFIPGTSVVAGKAAPGGDPRVYRVDGSEIALRRETTEHLFIRFVE
jgi:ferrous iron transport protein A